MNLPNDMKWEEDGDYGYAVWGVKWDYYFEPDVRSQPEGPGIYYASYKGHDDSRRHVESRAHAELIIRAIEAPETLLGLLKIAAAMKAAVEAADAGDKDLWYDCVASAEVAVQELEEMK